MAQANPVCIILEDRKRYQRKRQWRGHLFLITSALAAFGLLSFFLISLSKSKMVLFKLENGSWKEASFKSAIEDARISDEGELIVLYRNGSLERITNGGQVEQLGFSGLSRPESPKGFFPKTSYLHLEVHSNNILVWQDHEISMRSEDKSWRVVSPSNDSDIKSVTFAQNRWWILSKKYELGSFDGNAWSSRDLRKDLSNYNLRYDIQLFGTPRYLWLASYSDYFFAFVSNEWRKIHLGQEVFARNAINVVGDYLLVNSYRDQNTCLYYLLTPTEENFEPVASEESCYKDLRKKTSVKLFGFNTILPSSFRGKVFESIKLTAFDLPDFEKANYTFQILGGTVSGTVWSAQKTGSILENHPVVALLILIVVGLFPVLMHVLGGVVLRSKTPMKKPGQAPNQKQPSRVKQIALCLLALLAIALLRPFVEPLIEKNIRVVFLLVVLFIVAFILCRFWLHRMLSAGRYELALKMPAWLLPSDASKSQILLCQGRYDEAEKSAESDTYGIALLLSGKFDEAEKWLTQMVIYSQATWPLTELAWVYLAQDKEIPTAYALLNEASKKWKGGRTGSLFRVGGRCGVQLLRAWAHALSGEREEASQILSKWTQKFDQKNVPQYALQCYLAGRVEETLGQRAQARSYYSNGQMKDPRGGAGKLCLERSRIL